MQQHQQCIEPQRHRPFDIRQKTRTDDFYLKLERMRLSAASTKQSHQRSATELLDESKAFFVKSQEVLHKRQSLIADTKINEQKVIPSVFRMPHPRRSPYQDHQLNANEVSLESLNHALNSTKTSNSQSCADLSDSGLFESVSLLSFSDQTTLDSRSNSPSNIDRTVIPSANLTVIERNARIIKWLFQLNKANAPFSFQTVQ